MSLNFADFINVHAAPKMEQDDATEQEQSLIARMLHACLKGLRSYCDWMGDNVFIPASQWTWSRTKQVWDWMKKNLPEYASWSWVKLQKAYDYSAEQVMKLYGWSKETALPWVKQQSVAVWEKLVSLYGTVRDWTVDKAWPTVHGWLDYSWEQIRKGADKTWSGICIAYDWTADKLVDLYHWSAAGIEKLGNIALNAIATATVATVEFVLTPVHNALRMSFPMEMTGRMPHTIKLQGEYEVVRNLGARGYMFSTFVNNTDEVRDLVNVVRAAGGTFFNELG